MYQPMNLTAIGRIGLVKRSGSEWSYYRKVFTLPEKPDQAVIRLDSAGVCGITVNGEFVEAHTGRLPNRVTCVEITSRLQKGENTVELQLGSHYYQCSGQEMHDRRQAWFSYAAAELRATLGEEELVIATDKTWQCRSDDGQTAPQEFSQVTQAEYDRFWKPAALWVERKEKPIPAAVAAVAGKGYEDYCAKEEPKYARPQKIAATNMTTLEDGLTSRISDLGALYIYEPSEQPFVTYDFGRLEVGYVELEYESDRDGDVILYFDYSESTDDMQENSRYWWVVKRLSLRVPLKKGHHSLRLIHRRACRFMKLYFCEKYRTIKIKDVKILRSMTPGREIGWFHCSEELMNEAWEVGKYTLQVNKHQEYESCPRHEMKFFVGDGIIDSLIDYYAFGDPSLTDASLTLTEIEGDCGLRHDIYMKEIGLWDYPSWRISNIYNHYLYYGDKEFLKRYYPEMVTGLLWNIERMGANHLIYQVPIGGDCFFATSGSVEYNCSFDRLGEKPLLNALLYRSLWCMSQIAEILGDERGVQWGELAEKVHKAVNDRLWSEEHGAYIDTYDPSYIPQDGNAIAVLYGLADAEKAKKAMDTVRKENWSPYGSAILSVEKDHTRGGSRTISPAMCCHEGAARFLTGDAEGGLELIRRCWGTMLRKGAGTFWEFAPNNGHERWPIPSHAWSGGCTYLLSAFVLGVRPERPGYEVMRFAPYGGYEHFAGVVPTVKGLVAVACETLGDHRHYRLAVPKGMQIETTLPAGATLEVTEYV